MSLPGASATDLRRGFRLGDDRTVLPRENRLVGPQGEAHLEPRTMDVLVCLVGHAGEVVSRETLNEVVWEGAIVTDHALTNCISELRQILGDSPAQPRFIATVPKRGYRLIAPVAPLDPERSAREAPTTTLPASHAGVGTSRRRRLAGIVAAALLLAAVTGLGWWLLRSAGRAAARSSPSTVAVLPFKNLAGDEELAYLRLALPDEITTALTRASGLAVRPFEPTAAAEPAAAGRAMRASTVVTGHFYLEAGGRLSVTLEAVDVAREELAWRSRLTAPADDLLALREALAARVREGLLPALGAGPPGPPASPPASEEAYGIFLQSLSIPQDPEPNLRGIELLQHALRLDPGFAPAWASLALRHHRDGAYAEGGDGALAAARNAARRALAIDPQLVAPAQMLITLQTEAGELREAYGEAHRLVVTRPDSAQAHFALAYVLRYGGLVDAARRSCETALALDPYHWAWRSCAFSAMAAGDLDRAEHFIALDPGSYWANLVSVLVRLRRGDTAGALRFARQLPPEGADRRFLEACLTGVEGAPLDDLTRDLVARWKRPKDPEPAYWIGGELAWCGRREEALDLLAHAIEGDYCSFPSLDTDPLWDGLREDPELLRLRDRAVACRDRFRAFIAAEP